MVHCEILTFLHREMLEETDEINLPIEVNYYKVLKYSETHAKIYAKDAYSGHVLEFARQDGKWDFEGWDTIWSKTGSADDIMWPYFWHSVEGVAAVILGGALILLFALILLIVAFKQNHKNKFHVLF